MAGPYSGSVITPAAAAGAAFATIAAGASARTRILEIGMFANAATACSIGLFRATNTPVVTTSVAPVSHDPAEAVSPTTIGTAWSTAPTVGSVPLRRIVLPAAIGTGIIWQFEDLVCGPLGTGCLVLWNFGGATASACSLYVTVDD